MQNLNDKVKPHKAEGKLPANFMPMWSLDNANIHKAATKEWMNNPELRRRDISGALLPPPPYSPDLHKVIEHIHAHISKVFYKWLHENSHVLHPTITPYSEKVKEIIFKEEFSAKSIGADVDSLKETYREVIRLDGSYPASVFR